MKEKEGSVAESVGGVGGSRIATCQEVGRIPSVPPPQSLSRKRALTLPQPMADGVPSKPSTFGGVVYNGPKPGGAAEREGCMNWHYRHAFKLRRRLTQGTRGTCPTKTWHSVKVFKPVTYGQSPYCEVLEAP